MIRLDQRELPVLGIILGDHAGIGMEIVVKALHSASGCIPVLIGNRFLFEEALTHMPRNDRLKITALDDPGETPLRAGNVYFRHMDAGDDIRYGRVSADSGRLIYDSIVQAVELERDGVVDALVMGPITKQSLHAAGLSFASEFELFADLYEVTGVSSVIKCGNIFRATVVGHCAFSEIISRLSPPAIVEAARRLLETMRLFLPESRCRIAVAALNPHAGEGGLFGDEEARIITPAIERLGMEGVQAIGPCPADTVLLKAQSGTVGGIVYLYHDQGNIAMKSSFFGEAVLLYTGIPGLIVSVGHGSALDIAGRGVADPANLKAAIGTALDILERRGGEAGA